jgi:hypothetical protein
MKYTKYLLNNNVVDAQSIIGSGHYIPIKIITTLFGVGIAACGFGICMMFLPAAITFDSYRYLNINAKLFIKHL